MIVTITLNRKPMEDIAVKRHRLSRKTRKKKKIKRTKRVKMIMKVKIMLINLK